jgi:hypothetical protein
MRGNAKSPVSRERKETKKEERKELKKPVGKMPKESRRNSGVENNGKAMREAKDERGRRVR